MSKQISTIPLDSIERVAVVFGGVPWHRSRGMRSPWEAPFDEVRDKEILSSTKSQFD